MPKIIKNIISIPLLFEHGYNIKQKDKDCSIYHSGEFYSNGYVDNDLIFLSLNDNILHIDQIKKKKERKCERHISLALPTW